MNWRHRWHLATSQTTSYPAKHALDKTSRLTNIPRVKEGEYGRNSKYIVVLMKDRHVLWLSAEPYRLVKSCLCGCKVANPPRIGSSADGQILNAETHNEGFSRGE